MSNVSQWNTSAASNNSAAPNGAPEGMAPSSVNDTMREMMAAVARLYEEIQGGLVTGGTGNAYTLTTTNSHAALADQSLFVFRANRANTGAATLNVDALGAKAIESGGAALGASEIISDSLIAVAYNANNDAYDLLNTLSAAQLITKLGEIPDGSLSSNVPLLDALNTFTGATNTFEGDVHVDDGGSLRVHDATDNDYINFNHDGTDARTTFGNTTDWDVVGLPGDFWLRDGAGLKLSDSTDADSVTFSHDGTDFNTSFSGTTDWNISLGQVKIAAGANAQSSLHLGPSDNVSRGNSNDGAIRMYGENGGTLYGAFLAVVSSNISLSPYTSLGHTGVDNLQLGSGISLQILDSGNTDSVTQAHNGTDYNFTTTNTRHVAFTGLTGEFRIQDGAALRVYDSTDTGSFEISHDGTDAQLDVVNGDLDFNSVSIKSDNDTSDEPGWKGVPQNIQNGNYTLVIGDVGKQIYKASGGIGETITIPANGAVAFPIGTIVEIINDGGGDLSIAITTDTLEEYRTGTTGTQTLGDNNKAVIEKVAATLWKYSSTD